MTAGIETPDYHRVPCGYPWCEFGNAESHSGAVYTPATGRRQRVPLSLGVAVVWCPDEEPAPRLMVHTIDDEGGIGVDACLTLDEAIAFRGFLDTAISHVAGFDTLVPK